MKCGLPIVNMFLTRINFFLQVEILTRCYNPSPLVISGAGAGNDTTAAGVLSDVLDLRDLYQA